MYVPVTFGDAIVPREADIEATTFRALHLQERHLEEYIRRNIGDILQEETLLIVGQQVRNSSRGISDLTAVDGDGNIVLIEIKRDLDDITHRAEAFEMQAIRYAASYALIKTPEDLVELVFGDYVERHKDEFNLGQLTASERARRDLNQFLVSNEAARTFNRRQRILLVASAFDDQTLSAVAWLISNEVDISCVTITPVKIEGAAYLQIERVLPPPALNDFYVDLAAPQKPATAHAARSAGSGRAYLPRMDRLIEWGIVAPGDTITIRSVPNSTAEIVSDKRVRFQGEDMGYNEWGKAVTGWTAINVYEWSVLDKVGQTLDELRRAKADELATQAAVSDED